MIISSIANEITFKNLKSGNYPNSDNTLHEDLKHGNRLIIPYYQKREYNPGSSALVQFSSDSNEVPVLKAYYNHDGSGEFDETTGSLVSTRGTTDVRYYFNFTIDLSVTFYDNKKVYFILTQGTDTLTSEPVFCSDFTDWIAKGRLKWIYYANLDSRNSELDSRFIDWENLGVDYLKILVDCVNVDPNNTDKIELLEGSQSNTIVSAKNFAGNILATDLLPEYMVKKLQVISSLDYFAVNDTEYVKNSSDAKSESRNTSQTLTLNLTQKNAIGINVDSLGGLESSGAVTYVDQKTNKTTDYDIALLSGYFVGYALIKHSPASAGDAVVSIGHTIGGTDIVNAQTVTLGTAYKLPCSTDPSTFNRIYITIAGVGVSLDITIVFIENWN